MIAEGFTAVNDSQTVWIKRQGNSLLICAWFVDDVHHFTNDHSLYFSFRKRFEKRFDLNSDDDVQIYLGNRIDHNRVKGAVTVDKIKNTMSLLAWKRSASIDAMVLTSLSRLD